jgi:hypothetical protein
MMDKIVEKFGEKFIETSPKDWDARLEAWKADHTQPCPMPRGHEMFKKPITISPMEVCLIGERGIK